MILSKRTLLTSIFLGLAVAAAAGFVEAQIEESREYKTAQEEGAKLKAQTHHAFPQQTALRS